MRGALAVQLNHHQPVRRDQNMMTFTNQATLSYSGGTTNSNITVGQLMATLSAAKTALRDQYSTCDNLTYVISLVNGGSTAFTGLTLTDDLGGYPFDGDTVYPLAYAEDSVRYYVNGILQPAPAVTAGPPLAISGVSVPAGGNALIIYEADITRFAPLDVEGEITNTVTVTGGGVTPPLTASEVVTPAAEPRLTVTKGLSPTTVAENGRLTYTFTIQNTGSVAATATDDVVLTDTFTPILEDLVVTLNGAVLTEGTDYTYDETTGAFATLPGVITVPAATFAQDSATGAWAVNPGVATLLVSGTV